MFISLVCGKCFYSYEVYQKRMYEAPPCPKCGYPDTQTREEFYRSVGVCAGCDLKDCKEDIVKENKKYICGKARDGSCSPCLGEVWCFWGYSFMKKNIPEHEVPTCPKTAERVNVVEEKPYKESHDTIKN